MSIYRWLIVALWLVLGAYWAITAIGAKRNIGARSERRKGIALRLAIIVLMLLALRIPTLRQVLRNMQSHVADGAILGAVGVVLCALGVGLAVWARVHLDRNWGMPMSRKENPELITTGPYAYVRHPIYGGILLAMLGSTIGGSVFWVIPLVLFGAYFVHSARREEEIMISQFPEAYSAYMKRSNMLLPWPGRKDRNGG
jgi:protein-S-isoprenylcysteine O-methyltransferase Ste14